MMYRTHARIIGRGRANSGFTLIEAALVTSIIGFGVVGMLQLLATGTIANNDGAEMTTAINLARNIREMTLGLPFADPTTPTHWGPESGETLSTYDDLDDFYYQNLSPPIDARRQRLNEYSEWAQYVRVRSVDPDLLTLTVPSGSTPAARVSVRVLRRGKTICNISWLVFDASQ